MRGLKAGVILGGLEGHRTGGSMGQTKYDGHFITTTPPNPNRLGRVPASFRQVRRQFGGKLASRQRTETDVNAPDNRSTVSLAEQPSKL